LCLGAWEDNGSDYSGISDAADEEDEEFENQEGSGKLWALAPETRFVDSFHE